MICLLWRFDKLLLTRPVPPRSKMASEPGTYDASSNDPQSDHQSDKISTPLHTFTLFPVLPIEIRLKIWHWSFPRGREVNFADETIFKALSDAAKGTLLQFENSTPLPVTLRINKESRQETLKHYYIVFRGDNKSVPGEEKQLAKPFCYNPNLDTAWINPVALQAENSDKWFAHLEYKAPKAFSQTEVLELREWFCIWPSQIGLTRSPHEIHQLLLSITLMPAAETGKYLKPLLRFHGLKVLKYIPTKFFNTVENRTFRNNPGFHKYNDRVIQFFNDHKADFEGTVPFPMLVE